jgi:biotin transport system substrate-specific component
MFSYRASSMTLADQLWPYSARPESIRSAVLIGIGVCLLVVSAKIQIPLWPVPVTMQSFIVIMIGMIYGMRLGGATLSAYLLCGMLGLPVFASTPQAGVGVLYMLGPTGGYLVGFVGAALLTGLLAERGFDRTFLGSAVAMLAGHVLIFLPGLFWLCLSMNMDIVVGWNVGIAPFLPGMVAKIALGTAVMPLIWKFII